MDSSGGTEMYRSKVYVDRIISTNVVMGTNYGEAYLISRIYRSTFTHKYILTRSFGVGKGNITDRRSSANMIHGL